VINRALPLQIKSGIGKLTGKHSSWRYRCKKLFNECLDNLDASANEAQAATPVAGVDNDGFFPRTKSASG